MPESSWIDRALEAREPAPPQAQDRVWALAGLGLLLLALGFLTLRQPFYFTQDDNYAQFLPRMLVGLRGFFADGRFPDFDPYHFGGAPLAELGTYALTYPPTWIAYALARFGLGHETWTLEALAWLHLAGGYAAFLWAARRAGAAGAPRALGALVWALAGYHLIVGRSWYYMLPWALGLPLLFGGLLALRQGALRAGALAVALSLGVGFHSGNIQVWAYALGFALLLAGLWALAGLWTRRSAAVAALAGLAALGLALPLLWVQLKAVEGNLHIPGQGGAPLNPLALLLPWMQPSTASLMPSLSGGNPRHAGVKELLDMGSLLPALVLLLLPFTLRRWKAAAGFAWAWLALLAWVVAAGPVGVLWSLQAHLGPAKGFQHPIKVWLFVQFFMALGGCVLLSALLQGWRENARRIALGLGVLLLGAHVWRSDAAFYLWAEPAYPALDPALAAALPPPSQRIAGVSPRWMHRPGWANWMVHDLPGYYGRPSILGYDPLVSAHSASHGANPLAWNDTEAGLRAWGVGAVLVSPAWNEVPGFDPTEGKLLQWAQKPGHKVRQIAGLWLVDVPAPEPLALSARGPLNARADTGGWSVDLDGQGGAVRIATPAWPRWKASVDGRALPWTRDAWGRVQVEAPAGAKALRLEYSPAWLSGLLAGSLLLVLSLLGLRRFVQQ